MSFFVLSVNCVSAEVVNAIATCTGPNNSASCNNFTNIIIDTTKVIKIKIISNSFDDFGEVKITSPSGVATSLISSSGCPGTGSISNGDKTTLFSESGLYTIQVYASNDFNCSRGVAASVEFELTYTACLGPTSPLCDTEPANSCLELPGECVVLNNGSETCKYTVSTDYCDADGNDCTVDDFCDTTDEGITGVCIPGLNFCGGIVPCGRLANNPDTIWDDTSSCEVCHLVILVSEIINFMMGIVILVSILAVIVAGLINIVSSGNATLSLAARQSINKVLYGFVIVFIAWVIVNTVMVLFGFNDLMGDGSWKIFTCNL